MIILWNIANHVLFMINLFWNIDYHVLFIFTIFWSIDYYFLCYGESGIRDNLCINPCPMHTAAGLVTDPGSSDSCRQLMLLAIWVASTAPNWLSSPTDYIYM